MKMKPSNYTMIVSCAIAGLVLAGCAQQQQRGKYHPAAARRQSQREQAPEQPAPHAQDHLQRPDVGSDQDEQDDASRSRAGERVHG